MPIYNEGDQVGWVLDRFEAVLAAGTVQEVLAVDDGSTDESPSVVAASAHCTAITHRTREGIGSAIRSAYRYALEHDYDIVTILAGNGKDDPEQISVVLAPILAGEADYVQGSRFARGGVSRGLPWHRNLAIKAFTLTFSAFVGKRYTDCTNGFRAYRTSILRDPRVDWTQDWLTSYELEYYIHYKASRLFRTAEVPVAKVYRERTNDVSYSKMRAIDWLIALKPLFYLRLRIKR
jgi:glycosyltransferase involved in cell wall biosynthesis